MSLVCVSYVPVMSFLLSNNAMQICTSHHKLVGIVLGVGVDGAKSGLPF